MNCSQETYVGPHHLITLVDQPENSRGVVVFAHGSDSSCRSPRIEKLARRLRQNDLVTIRFDFLSYGETFERSKSFDPTLLDNRLEDVLRWVKSSDSLGRLKLGLFGSGTGMAAIVQMTAKSAFQVDAIVSRGGRTDLVESSLEKVTVPTLLIVGENDKTVLAANRIAAHRIHSEAKLEIIDGASHLFSEAGKLEQVGELAVAWFTTHFSKAPSANPTVSTHGEPK